MRHGERADYSPWKEVRDSGIDFDPPITDEGKAQATHTGKYFKDYIEKEGPFIEIKLESSPFLRCMMTAAYIAKEMGIEEFRINYVFSEKLNPYYFESNPID